MPSIDFWGKLVGVILLSAIVFVATSSEPDSVILIHNPYRFGATFEIKCDWTGKKHKYHNNIWVKPKSTTKIKWPKNFKKCEIWPNIQFWR